jgi:hypothetical protein
MGIDYGMGQTNIDRETGIRYGVISQHGISGWALGEFEPEYGDPTCPKCGNDAVEYDGEAHGEYDGDGSDHACDDCCYSFMSDEAFGDEPLGHYFDDEEYTAELHSDGDIFVTKSPYKTRADYCSPCAPGACHLENPSDDGDWCYCFGHDWFDDGQAPYRVYSVATGEVIDSESDGKGK